MHAKLFAQKWIAKFLQDDTTTLAASLAFYTALSVAPLMILFVAISSRLQMSLQSSFLFETQQLMGGDAANVFSTLLQSAAQHTKGLVGFVTLMISAGLIFGQLRVILNRIFNVVEGSGHATRWWSQVGRFLVIRLLDVLWALAFLAIITVGLLFTHGFAQRLAQEHTVLSQAIRHLVPGLVYFWIFILLFRYLPNCRISWHQVFWGGALTAFLFMVGREIIGFYLGHSSLASPYGAAGSIIVFLVWVYYSSLITFVGAQFSYLLDPKPHHWTIWARLRG